VLYNRNAFTLQRLVTEQDPGGKAALRREAYEHVMELRKEYILLQYGNMVRISSRQCSVADEIRTALFLPR
jgi:hypothetical protein